MKKNRLKEFWKNLGPGLTTGAADDDPSGIATYSQIGAARGFGLIWISLFSLPLLGVIQEMSARIGLVTGRGLAKNIKRHYRKEVLYVCAFLLVFANVFNIGADLGAMAKATELLLPKLPFAGLVIFFALFSLFLQVFVPYRQYSKYLKYLTLVLIVYILSAISIKADWSSVFRSVLVPSFSFTKEDVFLLCAALGTTISPYLFFWQTSQEVEQQIMRGHEKLSQTKDQNAKKELSAVRVDVWSGAFVSNIVMFFIIATGALTLFANGITEINTAEEAARALRPFAGDFAYFLFTIGILGTGLLAIPVLAGSASYAITESFGWKEGFSNKPSGAKSFYGVIALAVVLGILMNFVGIDPIKSLIYSAVLNGIISPIMIFFILQISSSKPVMGQYRNSRFKNLIGWLTFGIMSVVAVVTLSILFIK